MNSTNLFKEIKRFFIENLKLIIGVAIVSLLGFLIYNYVSFQGETVTENEEEETEVTHEIPEHIARFRFYVESSIGEHIGNANLFQIVLLNDDVISQVELETGTSIQQYLEWQEEIDFSRSVEDPGAIGLTRDGNSETIIFKTRIGTEEDSLAIAEAYYALLENGELEFFENKEVYMLEQPYLDIPEEAELSATYPRNQINRMFSEKIEENEVSFVDGALVGQSLIAVIAGLIFGTIIAYYKSQASKQINYLFNYEVKKDDLFFLVNNKDDLAKILLNPVNVNRVVLSEQNNAQASLKQMNVAHSDMTFDDSLLTRLPADQYEEVTLLIEEGQTSKEWYYQQREILKNYFSGTIKLIQFKNENISE